MANLYLSSGDNISGLTFGGNVFGAAGNEIITYANGVTGITVDQNVEQVRLGGSTSSYTYQQQGNQLIVRTGTTVVATITLQNDANGTLISFANGTVEAKVSAAGMTLGGTTVPSATADVVIPAVIDGTSGTNTPITNLTINQDSLVGTAATELFLANAVLAADGTTLVNTLQSIDTVDGGAGVDTLRFTQATATAITPTITNVENIEARFVGTGALNLASSTGVQAITVSGSTAAGTVNGVGSVNSLTVSNDVAGNAVTFGGSKAAEVTLNVTSYGAAGAAGAVTVTNSALTTLTVNANGSETAITENTATTPYKALNVNATGSNKLTFNNAGTVETLTVTGAGSTNFNSSAFAALKTVTAGTATGAVTGLTIGTTTTSVTLGSGADKITAGGALAAAATVNLGAGNDVLTLSVAPTAGATLTGGDGTDTIAFTGAGFEAVAAFSTANLAKITGFEVLGITDAIATGKDYDVSKITGVNSAAIVGVATGGAATVSGFTSGGTLTLQGALQTNDGALTAVVKDATTVGATADVLNLNIAGDATATVALTANGVETINVNAGNSATTTVETFTLNLTDTALTTLNVSGSDKFAFTSAAGQDKIVTVDASANTAGVSINLAAAVAAAPTINATGTSKADTFTLANDVVVKGNGGDDTFIIGPSSSGQTYSTISDATKGDKIDLGGAGTYTAAKIQLAGTAVFQDYLDAGAAGGATNNVSWFQFGGDTYLVQDSTAGSTFANGTDTVVKLTGLIDLSTAAFAGGIVTLG